MPEVNLLKDTQGLEPPPKPTKRPDEYPLTDPETIPRKGIGDALRSLFNRSPRPMPTPAVPKNTGAMSLKKAAGNERILNQKTSSRPAVIPLPEEEGPFGVNLLTEELVSQFDPLRQLMQLGFWLLGAIALVAVVFIGLSIFQQSVSAQVAATRSELNNVRSQISRLQNEQQSVNQTAAKVQAAQSLLQKHIHWTYFFQLLQKYTLPTVTYGQTFAGDVQGSLVMAARTSSFEDVATEYLILQQAVKNNDFISSFSITGATHQASEKGQSVNFIISFSVLPTVFTTAPAATPTPAVASTP